MQHAAAHYNVDGLVRELRILGIALHEDAAIEPGRLRIRLRVAHRHGADVKTDREGSAGTCRSHRIDTVSAGVVEKDFPWCISRKPRLDVTRRGTRRGVVLLVPVEALVRV